MKKCFEKRFSYRIVTMVQRTSFKGFFERMKTKTGSYQQRKSFFRTERKHQLNLKVLQATDKIERLYKSGQSVKNILKTIAKDVKNAPVFRTWLKNNFNISDSLKDQNVVLEQVKRFVFKLDKLFTESVDEYTFELSKMDCAIAQHQLFYTSDHVSALSVCDIRKKVMPNWHAALYCVLNAVKDDNIMLEKYYEDPYFIFEVLHVRPSFLRTIYNKRLLADGSYIDRDLSSGSIKLAFSKKLCFEKEVIEELCLQVPEFLKLVGHIPADVTPDKKYRDANWIQKEKMLRMIEYNAVTIGQRLLAEVNIHLKFYDLSACINESDHDKIEMAYAKIESNRPRTPLLDFINKNRDDSRVQRAIKVHEKIFSQLG